MFFTCIILESALNMVGFVGIFTWLCLEKQKREEVVLRYDFQYYFLQDSPIWIYYKLSCGHSQFLLGPRDFLRSLTI